MKHLLSALAFCAALPVCAQSYDLTVNAPATSETLKDAQTLSISPVSVKGGMTVLLDATMTFTLPSEDPEAPSGEDKISIMPNKAGEILVSNGTAWAKSGVTVKDYESKHVKIATVQETDGKLSFDVTIDGMAEPLRVAATGTDNTFGTLAFEGEGSVTNVAVAAVPTAILPAPDGGTQDAGLVSDYVTWLNDSSKGGAMPEGSSNDELSDAFAMNVGGTPKLTITRVSPGTDGEGSDVFTFTMKATYTDADGTEHDASLADINGTLYVISAETLDGEVTVEAQEMGGATELVAPAGARFAKVSVGFTEPEKKL